MASRTRKKVSTLLLSLNRKLGKVKRVEFMPPPLSADVDAAIAVATKNSEIIGGAVLGLHGPPREGADAARRLMHHYVDWNEVRVANPAWVARVLGRDPRAAERVTLLQRFLEAFFLRQRNLDLNFLVGLKPNERKQFFSNLEVFDREELAAVLLSCFEYPVFPPSPMIHEVARELGLIRQKSTVLQMAKEFQTQLTLEQMLALYSHLYTLARQPDKMPRTRKKSA